MRDPVAGLLTSPSTTDALRRRLPAGAVRSLGERGKKVGVGSVLPVALRLLELSGRVERPLEGGRLDSERYLWRVAKESLPPLAKVPTDAAARNAELFRIFLSWAGPAPLKDFASWGDSP